MEKAIETQCLPKRSDTPTNIANKAVIGSTQIYYTIFFSIPSEFKNMKKVLFKQIKVHGWSTSNFRTINFSFWLSNSTKSTAQRDGRYSFYFDKTTISHRMPLHRWMKRKKKYRNKVQPNNIRSLIIWKCVGHVLINPFRVCTDQMLLLANRGISYVYLSIYSLLRIF